jgi:hypothetical protein
MTALPCIFNDKDIIIQQEQVNMKGIALPLTQWNTTKQFFSINPVKHYGDNCKRENIQSMKNFLFESDVLSLEAQKELFKKHKGIISMATYSGNKSIHFIIQVRDTPNTIEAYRYVWKVLKDTYFPYSDNQCNDCVRLSRTPNAVRDNNKKQVLLWNTLQPIQLNWKPLYDKIAELKTMSMEYRKTIPILRNETLTYEAECILNGEYPKGERDAIINKGLPYLFYNGYSLNEILENNMTIRNNPQTIRNYYHKLENNYRGQKNEV